ncbi:MAG: hypothetical protein U0802_12115 [Candidatus Binatia bacterium]
MLDRRWAPRGAGDGFVAALTGTASTRVLLCAGDCDFDGVVLVNELVLGVNVALNIILIDQCDAYDVNGDGQVAVNELIAAVNNALNGCPDLLSIIDPADGLLVPAGTVAVRIALPAGVDAGSLRVSLDRADVTGELVIGADEVSGALAAAAGAHELQVEVEVGGAAQAASARFDAVALDAPDECEVLNNAECLLPYPSSRFLDPDPTTATGWRLHLPDRGLPVIGEPLTAAPLNTVDGFSPTVQILMHFPQGVDLLASGASRLLPPGCCGQPEGPPWIDTRTSTGRSLDDDSPSVLLDADTGERVLHWLELDARAAGNPARQALILRPGESLVPGHHYIVALRGLRAADGSGDVVAEPAFAALRDERPTSIAAIENRRAAMEAVFDALTVNGIDRAGLVLAFDFVVQSEDQLTRQMLSMRDQAFAYLATVEADAESVPFTITKVEDHDCSAPGAVTWRDVKGTFRSPLFLTQSPDQKGAAELAVDGDDLPVQNGFMNAVFSVAIPCSLLPAEAPEAHPIVLGHGLFGTGESMTRGVPGAAGRVVPWTYVAGATDWRGLSAPDAGFVASEVVGIGESQLNHFAALPDRLRQGMLNTLVLARMMKRGIFNRDRETFATPLGRPVFAGPDVEMYYYGISLGGIMGTWFSALTPDVERFGVDVPAINFSCLLQRSTQFSAYDQLLAGIGITDPMDAILGLGLLHELWVGGEPAGYARHITGDLLPGSGDPKRILMTPAWLDKQVSNQCTEIAARTLQLPNLAPGSLQRGLQGIPDLDGPLDSAYVMYDSGAFDIFNPAHEPFIPPLANRIPSPVCDPHGARPAIPAGIRQLANFLRPGGQIENFCDGDCDAGIPDEIAGGASTPCDPLK